jgi:hypothetical protein
MSWLRYMTLVSACRFHEDIRLVVRRDPVRGSYDWAEKQDFQRPEPSTDWFPRIKTLPVEIVYLENLAPEVAAFRAPDVQTCDMLGWWILSNLGGVVADMDIVWLKPLPQFRGPVNFVRYSGLPRAGYATISLLAGSPDPVWEKALANAMLACNPQVYASCGEQCLDQTVPGTLPETILNPWAGHLWAKYRRWLFEADDYPRIPEQTVGIEWYGGTNSDWSQKTTPETLPRHGAVRRALLATLQEVAI